MSRFEIAIKATGEVRTIYINEKKAMWYALINWYNIDEETAINIDSWSELATVDEQYETEDLIITCIC